MKPEDYQPWHEWLIDIFSRGGVYTVEPTPMGALLTMPNNTIDVAVLSGKHAGRIWEQFLERNWIQKIYTLPLFIPDGTYVFKHPDAVDLRSAGLESLIAQRETMVVRSGGELKVCYDQNFAWYLQEQADGWRAVPYGFTALDARWPHDVPKPKMRDQLAAARQIAYCSRPRLPDHGEIADVLTSARAELLPGYTARLLPDGDQVIAQDPEDDLPF